MSRTILCVELLRRAHAVPLRSSRVAVFGAERAARQCEVVIDRQHPIFTLTRVLGDDEPVMSAQRSAAAAGAFLLPLQAAGGSGGMTCCTQRSIGRKR